MFILFQIIESCRKLTLNQVFLSTDADSNEILELKRILEDDKNLIVMKKFENTEKLLDGMVSIVDQVINFKSTFFKF